MPDLLYILGTGSRWQDNEIRYSIRSAEAHFKFRHIFIVGERPSFLKDVVHIKCPDMYGEKKLKNSLYKLATAVRDTSLSSNFVLMNDDFLFLRTCEELPVAYKSLLASTIARHPTQQGYYFIALKHAMNVLKKHGIQSPKDFSLHVPILLNKFNVRKTMDTFGGAGSGYLFRSAYGNLWLPEAKKMSDKKITIWNDHNKAAVKRLSFLSTDPNVVLDGGFQRWIDSRFPKPSSFER